MINPRFNEIAKPDQESHENVSNLPKGSNPIRYFRSKYVNGASKESTAFKAYPEADAEDYLQFMMRHPKHIDKMDELQDSRFRWQETGITIDIRGLDEAADLILTGMSAHPVYAKMPDKFLKGHDQFIALMEYLRHLSLRGEKQALEIRSQIDSYISLSPDQIKILREYLLKRNDHIK
ncbi:MAG: hypothetical protein PHS79_04695 [Patescibacteria group bacterium]|nr:hypothetical protein [Patescibacteria group bacterium]